MDTDKEIEAEIERAVTDERHRCMDILTAARNGEIDDDLRSLIRRIEFGTITEKPNGAN